MVAWATGCRPTEGCCSGNSIFVSFLGGGPYSGGREKREPSARWDCSVADMHPAAVITGISVRVWSPANARHTASKQGTYLYPCRRLRCRMNLVAPRWAHKASLTAVVVMVCGLRPETSMTNWRKAGDPIRASGAGAGVEYAAC